MYHVIGGNEEVHIYYGCFDTFEKAQYKKFHTGEFWGGKNGWVPPAIVEETTATKPFIDEVLNDKYTVRFDLEGDDEYEND